MHGCANRPRLFVDNAPRFSHNSRESDRMGKGIKMRSARDGLGGVHTVDSLQAQYDSEQSIPDLFCDHPPCGCAVRFVRRSQQNRANRVEPIDVPAYIGLTSNSEHVPGCRYDAPGRIKTILAARSDPDFVAALDGGKRELRLLALHNGLNGRNLSGHSPPPGGEQPTSASAAARRSRQFGPTSQKLDSYLRTTADIVALRAICESDAPLAAELTLKLGPRRIPWDRFFFDRDRYDDAWDLVRAGGANAYPLALAGEVRSLHSPAPGATNRSSFLDCRPLYRRTDDPDRVEVFEVSVMDLDAAWLAGFPVGSTIVMFGLWTLKEPTACASPSRHGPNRTTAFVTHKLTLRPKFKRQVVAVP